MINRRVDTIAAATLFVLVWLCQLALAIGDFAHLTPDLNDDVLHLRLIDLVAETLAGGGDPTDPWLSTITLGYPLFHHYQHLPHLLLGTLSWLFGDAVSSLALLRASQLVLVLLFPLSIAWTTWRLADVVAGCFAGVAAILLASSGLFGLDASSYGWAGTGLTTQLWASVIIGPTWVIMRDAIHGRRGLALPAILLASLIITHSLLAYVTALTALVLCLVPRGRYVAARLLRYWRAGHGAGLWRFSTGLRRRLIRGGALIAAAVIGASYFVVPFLLDRAAMNRSVWEVASKYDAHGMIWTLRALVSGSLLDGSMHFRLPVLTAVLAVGLLTVFLMRPWRLPHREAQRLVTVLFAFWLLLFFGRPFWGALLDLLPLSSDLHFHRLIVPVQIAALLLIGMTAAALWRLFVSRFETWPARLLLYGLTAALLAQPLVERAQTYGERSGWLARGRVAFERDEGNLERILKNVRKLPPARVYAGRKPNWGGRYRIGAVPVYALLTGAGIDNLGYLYHALSLNADIEGYFDEQRAAHYRLFNVGYLLGPRWVRIAPFVVPIGGAGDHRLYRADSGGYFDLVAVPGVFSGTRAEWFDATRAWLASPAVEARQHPAFVLNGADPPGSRPMSEIPRDPHAAPFLGTITDQIVAPGRLSATVDVQSPCHLMAKVTHHPNWRAMVDGESRDTVMLAPAYVGVPLTTGSHFVELTYQPRPLRAVLRWLGVAFLLLLAVAKRRWPACRYL